MANISRQTLQRLPLYLGYLKALPADTEHISATALAQTMSMGEVQVRKDLATVSCRGRPRVGYEPTGLIRDIETFLGYDNADSAVIVGAGNMGRALLSYEGFSAYGLDVIAAFDDDPARLGTSENGKTVLPISKLEDTCREKNVKIGILTVPAEVAQAVCDMMIEAGVKAIWNFAPTHLTVPDGVLVRNENMAVSLAVLSRHLAGQTR